ncbi:MAG: hypothetical protein NC548_15475 [Lachnospiraceae bacterium]|nr:hypothetical protein [Lachnospiraceae bacterium]MCM1235772.1 hypothetical protein [Ruminococcus flavefaciens]
MGLMKRKYLFEADDDGTDTSSTSGEATDTGEDSASTDDSTTTDDTAETSDDTTEEENNDDDFSIDASPEDDDGSEGDNGGLDDTSSSDDSSSDDMSSDNTEESEIDAAMFETLDDNEKRTKIAELKKLFMDLYSKCDILVNKFNSIDEDDDEVNPVVKRIVKILYDTKEYVSYYLLNVFNSKSYIENMVVFKRHLVVLNGIKKIVQEIEKEQEKQADK